MLAAHTDDKIGLDGAGAGDGFANQPSNTLAVKGGEGVVRQQGLLRIAA